MQPGVLGQWLHLPEHLFPPRHPLPTSRESRGFKWRIWGGAEKTHLHFLGELAPWGGQGERPKAGSGLRALPQCLLHLINSCEANVTNKMVYCRFTKDRGVGSFLGSRLLRASAASHTRERPGPPRAEPGRRPASCVSKQVWTAQRRPARPAQGSRRRALRSRG